MTRLDLANIQTLILSGAPVDYEPRPHVLFGVARNRGDVSDLGFATPNLSPRRDPASLRILCLGASTTESGNRMGYKGSYPYFLGLLLGKVHLARVEVANFGVSAWTTAETLVNYVLFAQDLEPDLVIVHHAINDIEPRALPGYRSDYFHFRKPWEPYRSSALSRILIRVSRLYGYLSYLQLKRWDIRHLVTRARPELRPGDELLFSPETSTGFLRNLRTISDLVHLRGGRIVLTTMPGKLDLGEKPNPLAQALEEQNRLIRELARERGYILVDLATEFEARRDTLEGEFLDICHLTPRGNRFKARILLEALAGEGILDPDHPPREARRR
jgi:lysophospholipase L1-like esterase